MAFKINRIPSADLYFVFFRFRLAFIPTRYKDQRPVLASSFMNFIMFLGRHALQIVDVIIASVFISMMNLEAGRNLLLMMLFPKLSIVKYHCCRYFLSSYET